MNLNLMSPSDFVIGGALNLPDPLPSLTYELARYSNDAEDFRATVKTEREAVRWVQDMVAMQFAGAPITGYVLACPWPTYPAPTADLRPYKILSF